MYSESPPVLIIGFRRASEIEQVVKNLESFRPQKVYLAMDGPRNLKEAELTKLSRNVSLDAITWQCETKTFFSDLNRGCAAFVVDAITWFFSNETFGIIVEDDILIHQSFVQFVQAYQGATEFSCLCSCTYEKALDVSFKTGINKPFCSKIPSIWGWCTRSEVWEAFLNSKRSSNPIVNFVVLFKRIGFWQSLLFSMCLNYIDRGLMSAWDYEFAFFLIASDRISLFPPVQMSCNIGNSSLATNCQQADELTEALKPTAEFNASPPALIRINRAYMRKQALNTLMNPRYKLQASMHALKLLLSLPKVLLQGVVNTFRFVD